MTYNNRIKRSLIPNETIWDIVKTETGKTNNDMKDKIDKLRNGDKLVNDYTNIVQIFNQHFTTIMKANIINKNQNTSSVKNSYKITPIHYLH